MTNNEAVNWIINMSADIGKAEHRDLWHYEQALSEIRDMLESHQPEIAKYINAHCNDTIYRQAAIDAVHKSHDTIYRENHEFVTVGYVERTLLAVPPAQSDVPFEIQDILDYLDTALHPIISPEHWNVYSELHDMISTLSSTQPEIVRCKDCRHNHNCDIQYHAQAGDMFYCAGAERRTDGTD